MLKRLFFALAVVLSLSSQLEAQVAPWGASSPIFGSPAAAVSGSGAVTSAQLLLPDGTVALPALAFSSDPDTGWYWTSSGAVLLSINGTLTHQWGNTYYANSSNSAAIQFGAAGDTVISRGAANRFDIATGDSLYLVSGGLGVGVVNTTAGTIASSAAIGPVAGVVTEGLTGVPVVAKVGRITAQSSNATIATLTTPAVDGSYEISANMNVTASSTLITTLTCTYTDEAGTARSMILPVASLAGTFITAGAITGAGATVWETPAMHIRVKASTAITILTSAGTFTGVTYTADAVIRQLK